jgi:hypothetical protein
VHRDAHPRPETTLADHAKLRPIRHKADEASTGTAGTASGPTDGAARDHHRGRARGDLPGRVQDSLEAGAATPVQLEAGYADAEAGVQCRNSADRGGLAVGVALAEDHVVDVTLAEPGPSDQLGKREGRQADRAQRGQGPSEAPHGRADRFTDDDIVHAFTVGVISDIEKYPFRLD